MFEKNLLMGVLIGHYGRLLSERKLDAMEMYYYEDLSLSEIAQQLGISRQGVRDLIVKAQEELSFYEERLGLARLRTDAAEKIERIEALLRDCNASEELVEEFSTLCELIKA